MFVNPIISRTLTLTSADGAWSQSIGITDGESPEAIADQSAVAIGQAVTFTVTPLEPE